jgi:hypothetical protein
MMPAISIFPADTSAMLAIKIANTLGGMIGSRLAPASTVPAENCVSYPRPRMAGKSERPSSPATAIAAPESAPSMADKRMHTTYWRPRNRPTSRSIESNSTSIAPERNMISPMAMKSGTAVRVPVVAVV